MKTFLSLLVFLALSPTPTFAQKAKSKQPPLQQMRKCGEEAPVVQHPFGSLSFNGKPIQLNSAMQHHRQNLRYVMFEVSVSDTTLPLGPAAAPGMLLGIAIRADQKPGILTLAYVQQVGSPNAPIELQAQGAFLQAHGYLANAGSGSVLEVNLTKNNKDRLEGTFTLKGTANPKLNFPAGTLEGKFHSPAPMKMSWDVQ
jgi:hypothetical protein